MNSMMLRELNHLPFLYLGKLVSLKRKQKVDNANSTGDEEYGNDESQIGGPTEPSTKKCRQDAEIVRPQQLPSGLACQAVLSERPEVGIMTESELYKNGSIRQPFVCTNDNSIYMKQYALAWQIPKEPSASYSISNYRIPETLQTETSDLDRSGERMVEATSSSMNRTNVSPRPFSSISGTSINICNNLL